MTDAANLPAASCPFTSMEIGTTLLLSTADRRHPFRADIAGFSRYGVMLKTARTSMSIVIREDGSISHLMRMGQRRSAMPTSTKITDWSYCG